jgi:imidazolonepropionase-like amidohydrolase
LLDPLYVWGTLWGILPGLVVCPSGAIPLPRAPHEAIRPSAPAVSAGVTAFVDVNVVPMDSERVLAHQTVLVQGGRIAALGPMNTVKVPAGAVRIDGRGKYLMPGLGDMHAHPKVGSETGSESDKRNYRNFRYLMASYVASGVTTMRLLDADNPPESMRLEQEEELVLRPRLYHQPHLYHQSELARLKARLDSVAVKIAAFKAAGYDFITIKAHDIGSAENGPVLDSILAAARRVGLPVATHDHGATFEQLAALGVYGGSAEHLAGFAQLLQRPSVTVTDAELRAVAAAAARSGTYLSVTLDCVEERRIRPAAGIRVARRLVKALQEAGAPLLLGLDADGGKGASAGVAHEELKELVRAGLSPYQALMAGTRNIATYFRLQDSVGTVTVGKWADLVLLNGNPLENIRHTLEPAGVMVGGHWFDRTALDQALLASPTHWFWVEVWFGIMPTVAAEFRSMNRDLEDPPYDSAQRRKRAEHGQAVWDHFTSTQALADSLDGVPLSDSLAYGPLVRRLTEELTKIRVRLTPEQRETFDVQARVWMREQARRGYPVTVAGVATTP